MYISLVVKEVKSNIGVKSKFIVLLFRILSCSNSNFFGKILTFPLFILYKLLVDIFWGVELPPKTNVGVGLKITHAKNITIHPLCCIGENVHIRHGVTIGNLKSGCSDVPLVGDNVDFGCNSSVLGKITISDNVVVGAHSLVLKDINSNSVVVGVPAKVVIK